MAHSYPTRRGARRAPVSPLLAGCAAAVMLLAGCGHKPSAPAEPGFYRHGDESTVFSVQPASKTFCIVSNPSMMEAYGGFPQVHVVGHEVDIAAAGTLTGACRWPPGTYRKVDSDVVYRVRESDVCRVEPYRQAPRPGAPPVRVKVAARVISSDSNVLVGARFSGDCP